MAPPASRSDSPFTKEQEIWIILEWGATKNITTLKRNFRTHFEVQLKKVPSYNAFKRLVKRFEAKGELHQATPKGKPPVSEEAIARVKDFLKPYLRRKESVSLLTISNSLDIPLATVWVVVRKKLGWFPYKPRKTIPLTEAHKQDRVNF